MLGMKSRNLKLLAIPGSLLTCFVGSSIVTSCSHPDALRNFITVLKNHPAALGVKTGFAGGGSVTPYNV
jgi:hypothetical protein